MAPAADFAQAVGPTTELGYLVVDLAPTAPRHSSIHHDLGCRSSAGFAAGSCWARGMVEADSEQEAGSLKLVAAVMTTIAEFMVVAER